jgi:hypothetical protein
MNSSRRPGVPTRIVDPSSRKRDMSSFSVDVPPISSSGGGITGVSDVDGWESINDDITECV